MVIEMIRLVDDAHQRPVADWATEVQIAINCSDEPGGEASVGVWVTYWRAESGEGLVGCCAFCSIEGDELVPHWHERASTWEKFYGERDSIRNWGEVERAVLDKLREVFGGQ